jgi:hypothetical protein
MPVQTQIQVRRSTAATWTSTNPTLAAGELGFETDTGKFKIGTGSSTWTALSYAGGGSQATITTYQYTATAGQTTFSGVDANGNTLAYTAGSVQVYLNGVLLVLTSDYTASNGTSVVLGSGALVGDNLTVVAVGTFTVSTDIPKSTLTAKGSIVAATAASTPANLSVGTDGQVLTAASGQATGLQWATPSSGGMTSIASGSLSGTSVAINSIPGTYNGLILRIFNSSVSTGGGNSLGVRINGNTSGNYDGTYLQGSTSTVTRFGGRTSLWANGTLNELAATVNFVEYYFPSYASSNCSKPVTITSVKDTDPAAFGIWQLLAFTDAITSLTIIDNGGLTFDAGTYVLYGVK